MTLFLAGVTRNFSLPHSLPVETRVIVVLLLFLPGSIEVYSTIFLYENSFLLLQIYITYIPLRIMNLNLQKKTTHDIQRER